MKISLALTICCLAAPVFADDARMDELTDLLGGHGCTLGRDSSSAAIDAGFTTDEIRLLALNAQAYGDALAQGGYIVFDAEVCTIRLPKIDNALAMDDPFVQSITSAPTHFNDLYGTEDGSGCFLLDAMPSFDRRAGGGAGSGFDEYFAFVADSLIKGELRFYGTDPLVTPISFQVTVGEGCDSAPNSAALRENHKRLVDGFGAYVRAIGAAQSCLDDTGPSESKMTLAMAAQNGAVPEGDTAAPPNVWMFLEYDIISYVAGWQDGMTAAARGTPRPPLCHYPDQ